MDPRASGPSPSGIPAQFFTVPQLAATIGCEANLMGKAADYRPAKCTVDGAEFVFVDFDTAEGQRAWLDYATLYGGVYLVGDRWALSGKSKEYIAGRFRVGVVRTVDLPRRRGGHGVRQAARTDQQVTLTVAAAWNDTCTWSRWLAVALPRSSIADQPLPSL
jgi:hypothetical protein